MRTPFLRAFTMVELLVVVVIVATLAFVLMPPVSKDTQTKARLIRCNNHLKNVGLAQRIFATDNSDLFPWERSSADLTNQINFPDLTGVPTGDQVVRIYRSLSNELATPKIIACPADVRESSSDWRAVTTNNISYFVGLSARESLPQSFLAGDRNLVLDENELTGRAELKSGAQLAWSKSIHRFQGEVAMSDGSVQQFTSGKAMSFHSLKEALANTGVETNVFLIP